MVCMCEWDYFLLHYQQWVDCAGCGICSWCRRAEVCVLCACGYSPWDHCASLRVSGLLPRIDPSIYSRHKGKPTQSFTACGSHQSVPVICVWARWGFTSREFWGVCGLPVIIWNFNQGTFRKLRFGRDTAHPVQIIFLSNVQSHSIQNWLIKRLTSFKHPQW